MRFCPVHERLIHPKACDLHEQGFCSLCDASEAEIAPAASRQIKVKTAVKAKPEREPAVPPAPPLSPVPPAEPASEPKRPAPRPALVAKAVRTPVSEREALRLSLSAVGVSWLAERASELAGKPLPRPGVEALARACGLRLGFIAGKVSIRCVALDQRAYAFVESERG